MQSICEVLMCLYSIVTEYNGQLQALHAQIDDDRYDKAECGAAGQPTLDLFKQLQGYVSLSRMQSICAVLMCLYSIATE